MGPKELGHFGSSQVIDTNLHSAFLHARHGWNVAIFGS
jgi:hypothetical protein